MKTYIEQFANQLQVAYQNALNLELKPKPSHFQHIAILGLGGSAFGGELIKNYSEKILSVPVTIIRDYTLPNSINANTLVITSSYSGNTEETLSAFEEAIQKGAFIVCITSGGKLLQLAQQHSLPYIQLPTGYPPRAAVGFSFISKLTILHKLGLIPDFYTDFQESLQIIQNFSDYGLVHEMVEKFYNKIPVVYTSPAYEAVAIRLRQQIEENSKQLCWHHVIPEMNHNELVGWLLPTSTLPYTHVLILKSPDDHPRILLRMNFVKQKLGASELTLKGTNKMARLLYGLHLSDWISYYLAEKNQVDPTPVHVIDELKNSLASQ